MSCPGSSPLAKLANCKSGPQVRRGRLLIISPVQQPSWLSSGRNPTYPIAQILQATSHIQESTTQWSALSEHEPCRRRDPVCHPTTHKSSAQRYTWFLRQSKLATTP